MSSRPDDERLGLALRAIRRRLGMTQAELAERAAIPIRDVMAIEAGGVGEVKVGRLRATFAALDGGARVSTWWHGAAADRLLDERHAGIVERAVGVLIRRGWTVALEVTFSEYGERGSIDLLGAHLRRRAIVVGEAKGSIGSIEETNRSLDIKVRHAPKLAEERFGFRPRTVGRLLVVPEDRSIRRIVAAHARTMGVAYPARGHEVRAWLRDPDRPIRGIWFLSDLRPAKTDVPA